MKTDLTHLERRREPPSRTPTPIPQERLSGAELAQLKALRASSGVRHLYRRLGVGQATLEAALAGELIASKSAATIRSAMGKMALAKGEP